jgi:hypothetical protein
MRSAKVLNCSVKTPWLFGRKQIGKAYAIRIMFSALSNPTHEVCVSFAVYPAISPGDVIQGQRHNRTRGMALTS